VRRALGEASALAAGKLSGAVVALAVLLSIILGSFVNPIAGGIALAVTLVALVIAFIYALRMKGLYEGPYAVRDNDVSWDISGDSGELAKIRNHRHVRFNYRCVVVVERLKGMPPETIETLVPEYGEVIKVGRRPDEDYVIVELPADKERGDVVHLAYQLTQRDGFMRPEQRWIGHATAKGTRKAKLDVAFPPTRPPVNVTLWRESNDKTESVKTVEGWEDGMRAAMWTEGGRVHFRLRERPKRKEVYRLEWEWDGD
jgi:hypothetical protein